MEGRCALFAGATQLLRNKDSAGAVRALYEEPRDSLDVVFVGSSHILNGAFPLELWHEYGIVSNNLGQHGQSDRERTLPDAGQILYC